MKKNLVYLYCGVMFACLFGAASLPLTYQKPAIVFGIFLLGMFFVIGMPVVWCKKEALRGQGLNVEFTSHPIIYTIWLLLIFGVGLMLVAFAMICAISHAIGIALVPWLW